MPTATATSSTTRTGCRPSRCCGRTRPPALITPSICSSKAGTNAASSSRAPNTACPLTEGEHSFWFTTADGEPSPTTQVAIRFDNGATAAQILAPTDNNSDAGDTVEVTGVALIGSTVAVGSTPLPTDEQGRFHGRVPAPDARALAIRLQHPASGIHYYIRHLRAR
jgi:hypothetical protein